MAGYWQNWLVLTGVEHHHLTLSSSCSLHRCPLLTEIWAFRIENNNNNSLFSETCVYSNICHLLGLERGMWSIYHDFCLIGLRNHPSLCAADLFQILPLFIVHATSYFGRIVKKQKDQFTVLAKEMNDYFKVSGHRISVNTLEKSVFYGLREGAICHR